MADLDDEALIAAIPAVNLGDCTALATEAARRRLAAAIPALEALCRRFAGFGIDRVVPEQSAALQARGGHDAAQAIARLIVRGVVQGPALGRAVAVAAQLRASLRLMSCYLFSDTPILTSVLLPVAALADDRSLSL